jgi:hypothetical protein
LSHGIRRQGLKCLDCHNTTSVLDFPSLGYSAQQASRVATMLTVPQIASISKLPSGLHLKWTGLPEKSYQLLYATQLVGTNWRPVTAATTAYLRVHEYTVPQSLLETNQMVFFKVIELPK